MRSDDYFMNKAQKEAQKALILDEVPVGAVIVKDNKIIARGHNLKESRNDPTAHAEIVAIRKAAKKLNTWHLDDCTLYVTLEPCSMCAGAIIQARIKRLVYGALDKRVGAVESLYKMYDIEGFNHYPETFYYSENENCGKIISMYFKTKR